jgi:hypothetical protein
MMKKRLPQLIIKKGDKSFTVVKAKLNINLFAYPGGS